MCVGHADSAKAAEPVENSRCCFSETHVSLSSYVLHGGIYGCHLANTIKRSVLYVAKRAVTIITLL